MVREEGVRVLVGHVVGQVVAGVPHQDGEEGQPDQHRIQDVVGADRQPLPLGLELMSEVAVGLDDLHLFRRHHGRSRSFPGDVLVAHSGSEIPCARMKRKWTYMRPTMRAGSTNTCSVKKRCSVGGPTTGPPWSSSLMNRPSCAGG